MYPHSTVGQELNQICIAWSPTATAFADILHHRLEVRCFRQLQFLLLDACFLQDRRGIFKHCAAVGLVGFDAGLDNLLERSNGVVVVVAGDLGMQFRRPFDASF